MDSTARFASTAKWIAAARAKESARSDRLLDDPYAAALAGQAGVEILNRSEAASGGENPFLPVRTRYFDDLILTATGSARQVVLLGAGLDTRAYRLALPEDTRVFELDRAEVLEEKERLLSELGARPRCVRRAVPTNLAGSWTNDLMPGDFDPAIPAVWIAEGLLYYLAEDQMRSLLIGARGLSAPGSMFAADVFGTGILRQPQMQPYLDWLAKAGLPPPFTCDDPAALLAGCGWMNAKTVEPGQSEANFGRIPVRGAGEGTNRAYLATALAIAPDSRV